MSASIQTPFLDLLKTLKMLSNLLFLCVLSCSVLAADYFDKAIGVEEEPTMGPEAEQSYLDASLELTEMDLFPSDEEWLDEVPEYSKEEEKYVDGEPEDVEEADDLVEVPGEDDEDEYVSFDEDKYEPVDEKVDATSEPTEPVYEGSEPTKPVDQGSDPVDEVVPVDETEYNGEYEEPVDEIPVVVEEVGQPIKEETSYPEDDDDDIVDYVEEETVDCEDDLPVAGEYDVIPDVGAPGPVDELLPVVGEPMPEIGEPVSVPAGEYGLDCDEEGVPTASPTVEMELDCDETISEPEPIGDIELDCDEDVLSDSPIMNETPAAVVPSVDVVPVVPSDDAPLPAGGPLAEDDIDAFLPESDLDDLTAEDFDTELSAGAAASTSGLGASAIAAIAVAAVALAAVVGAVFIKNRRYRTVGTPSQRVALGEVI